jgi:hypothetical protein
MSHLGRVGKQGCTEEPQANEEPQAKPETSHAEDEATYMLLELLVEQISSPPPLVDRVEGVVVGRIASVSASGAVCVTFAGVPAQGLLARVTMPITKADEGRDVALMFEEGDPRRPIVMGKVVSPIATGRTEATIDARRFEISAEEEIVLRCGDSSITLTRAGKIIIQGAYVLSRSSGVNRIQGGSVEIN